MDAGCLNIHREQSRDFVAIFGQAPNNILENRPETASHFLGWLIHREETLEQCITKDLRDRNLSDGAYRGLSSLQNPLGRVRRAIQYELLERTLYMYRWAKKHTLIAASTTLSDLVSRCLSIIGSLQVDEHFLKRFRLTRADLVNKGILSCIASNPLGWQVVKHIVLVVCTQSH